MTTTVHLEKFSRINLGNKYNLFQLIKMLRRTGNKGMLRRVNNGGIFEILSNESLDMTKLALKYRTQYYEVLSAVTSKLPKFINYEHYQTTTLVLPEGTTKFSLPPLTIAYSIIVFQESKIDFKPRYYSENRKIISPPFVKTTNFARTTPNLKLNTGKLEGLISQTRLTENTGITKNTTIRTVKLEIIFTEDTSDFGFSNSTYKVEVESDKFFLIRFLHTYDEVGELPDGYEEAIETFFFEDRQIYVQGYDSEILSEYNEFITGVDFSFDKLMTMAVMRNEENKRVFGQTIKEEINLSGLKILFQPPNFTSTVPVKLTLSKVEYGKGVEPGTVTSSLKVLSNAPTFVDLYRTNSTFVQTYHSSTDDKSFLDMWITLTTPTSLTFQSEITLDYFRKTTVNLKTKANPNVGIYPTSIFTADQPTVEIRPTAVSNNQGYDTGYEIIRKNVVLFARDVIVKEFTALPTSFVVYGTRYYFSKLVSGAVTLSKVEPALTTIGPRDELFLSTTITKNPIIKFLTNPLGLEMNLTGTEISNMYKLMYLEMRTSEAEENIQDIRYRFEAMEKSTRTTPLGYVTMGLQTISNFLPPVRISVVIAELIVVLTLTEQIIKGDYMGAFITGATAFLGAMANRRSKGDPPPQLEDDHIKQFSSYISSKDRANKLLAGRKINLTDSIKSVAVDLDSLPGANIIAGLLNSKPNSRITKFFTSKNIIPEHHRTLFTNHFEINGQIFTMVTGFGVADGVRSNTGSFNIAGLLPNLSNTLGTQPGVFCNVYTYDSKGERVPYVSKHKLKQYKAMHAQCGAKRSDLIVLENIEEVDSRYGSTFDGVMKKLNKLVDDPVRKVVDTAETTLFPAEHAHIIKHMTSQSARENIKYDLVLDNCQYNARNIIDFYNTGNIDDRYAFKLTRKTTGKLTIDNIEDLDQNLLEIYDSILSLAPGL